MTPFYTRFPEIAAAETRVTSGGPLPRGEYGFVEFYCDEPDCDCRRVLVNVCTPQAPDHPLAIIFYGWETLEFYTETCHGDLEAARSATEARLDPLNPQSKYARHLLAVFQDTVKNDPAYVARLARHYQMFKSTQQGQAQSTPPPSPSATDDGSLPHLTIPEILRQLERVPEKANFAPYEDALLNAIEQREAIIPELIAAIDRVSADPARYLAEEGYTLQMFAIYLLAEFREPRALDCFLRFFSLPGEQSLDLTGDMVTEHGAAVLASVCGGDPVPLLKLIHADDVNMFVRSQAMHGLVVQAVWGERPRAAAVEELRRLFQTLPKPGHDYVWATLVCLVCDYHVLELAPPARQAFAEKRVDESVLDLKCFEEDLAKAPAEWLADFGERNAPIDAASQCSCWICFRDDDSDNEPWDDEAEAEDALAAPISDQLAQKIAFGEAPYVAPPKVGRNELCPCGSGKKFKKCCGA